MHNWFSFLKIANETIKPVFLLIIMLDVLIDGGTRYSSWLRHYATNQKVAGSKPDVVIELFSIYLILPAALRPGVYSAAVRKKMFQGSTARLVLMADNLTAICEPIV
jgi:hypothetical protein